MADAALQFGEFRFCPATGELTKNHAPVALEHQPALLLACLLASRGQLVTRTELAAAIWGHDTHVKFDDGLNYCVRQVRAALGDDSKSPRFIETVPRRGYRFVGTFTAPNHTGSSRRILAAAVAAALIGCIAVVESQPNNHHEMAVTLARAVHDVIF
jgi:DNA-binding winged helix-turn-helix (wHTH) protein